MIHVKICGITNLQDARAAAAAGAELLGFNFFPGSPRCISPETAKEIVGALRAEGAAVRCVGVFVDAPLERVRQVVSLVGLELVQLHGSEPPQLVAELAPRAFKALRPRSATDAQKEVDAYRAAVNGRAPAFIVDAFDPHRFGGTGKRADWPIAARIARQFPVLLAGGLTSDNVQEAIRAVRPWGVDVSSGVERAPGLKDHEQMRLFIERAKGV